MQEGHLKRRDFSKLTAAALGGVALGTGLTLPGIATAEDAAEVHICKGLNACKGKGVDGKNDCAGMGACATAKKHGCHGHNDCKGQGGCGAAPGQNECKGKGDCGVPLKKKAWGIARKSFEASMKEKGKKIGQAPKE